MMQTVRRGVLLSPLALALALPACRQREQDQGAPSEPPAVAAPAPAAAPAKKRTHPPLPEDPELAAKASAQWQEHLDEEEEHRQLCYDRDRLGQHRAVMKQLESLRHAYDQPRSEAEVAAARANARKLAPELQKQFDAIDPWKNSSMALPEQRAMLKLLTEEPTSDTAAELDRHAESIRKVLERAERCKDE